jgi:hypothetical protein
MTILSEIRAWICAPRGLPALGGALLALVGAAWLAAVPGGSVESKPNEFTYRPFAGPVAPVAEDPVAKDQVAKDQVAKDQVAEHPVAENKPSDERRHPLDDAFEFVQPSVEALKSVKDYTAVFTKTELVHGRLLTQKMDMKFRQNPFSVYFHCHSKRKEGREVIYVAGRNDGKLIVHEVGLKAVVGTMTLKPEDPKVMATNRYPITEVGIAKIIESAMAIWNDEKKTLDPANIEVRIVHSVQVGSIECEAVEIDHHHQQAGLTYQVGRVYVDKQTKLPVQAEMYGFPATPGDDPPLLEQYTYTNVKTNLGLSDADFDPHNRDYRFALSQRD